MKRYEWSRCAVAVGVVLFLVSIGCADILSDSDFSEDGNGYGSPTLSSAWASSSGEDDWVTGYGSGWKSMWTTVYEPNLVWEFTLQVDASATLSIWDNEYCIAAGIAEASGQCAYYYSNSLSAEAVIARDTNGTWQESPPSDEDQPWGERYFYADEGVSTSHASGALASVPLGSSDDATASASASATCHLEYP